MVIRSFEPQKSFASSFEKLFLNYGPHVKDANSMATLLGTLLEYEGASSKSARYVMEISGLRRAWNETLLYDRAAEIAAWVLPFLSGPVADIFAGDLSVSRAIAEGGVPVLALERGDISPSADFGSGLIVREVRHLAELASLQTPTALISTVLHHEEQCEEVLRQLSRSAVRRWVIIENCVDHDAPAPFHLAADLFFNTCLNDSPLFCGAVHRTSSGWRDLLGRHGTVVHQEQRGFLPGIFLPHTLFVVEV